MKYKTVLNNKVKEGLFSNALKRNADYVDEKNNIVVMVHMYTNREKLDPSLDKVM